MGDAKPRDSIESAGSPSTTSWRDPETSVDRFRLDKADLGLLLAAYAALSSLFGALAAAIVAAFVLGLMIGRGQGNEPRHPDLSEADEKQDA